MAVSWCFGRFFAFLRFCCKSELLSDFRSLLRRTSSNELAAARRLHAHAFLYLSHLLFSTWPEGAILLLGFIGAPLLALLRAVPFDLLAFFFNIEFISACQAATRGLSNAKYHGNVRKRAQNRCTGNFPKFTVRPVWIHPSSFECNRQAVHWSAPNNPTYGAFCFVPLFLASCHLFPKKM